VSPAEGGALRIVKVELAGFGLYARPTRVLFPEAAGVLCSANESGKSTLLHAISAVLFGLPSSGDPSVFGSARFRSFGHAGEFWGAVAWESSGRRFRLHRAFDSHQVRLLEETAAGPRVLYSGEHNPMGRSSSSSSFAAVLREHFGFASIDLFRRTFCVTQPVPDDSEVDSELQHLLSGSRSGRVEEVLSRLFSEMKALTRATGDL
jgi:chromosome segregation protein